MCDILMVIRDVVDTGKNWAVLLEREPGLMVLACLTGGLRTYEIESPVPFLLSHPNETSAQYAVWNHVPRTLDHDRIL